MKYLPFLSGTYSTAPGLIPMQKASGDDSLVFQIDGAYEKYINNKILCRKENMHKYYCEHKALPSTIKLVNRFIAQKLSEEHPSFFEYNTVNNTHTFINKKYNEIFSWNDDNVVTNNEKYISVFDALCSQMQEDTAVCQLNSDGDYMAAIHLCAPNHWSPQDKIGKPFNAVHAPVPGMEKTMPHYYKMLQSIVERGAFTRFAWGIASDTRLNHHPQAPKDFNATEWYGRKITGFDNLYVRTERQNLIGFPQANAFLFTIRTYFYAVDDLTEEEKKSLWLAVKTMEPASLEYKGLTTLAKLL